MRRFVLTADDLYSLFTEDDRFVVEGWLANELEFMPSEVRAVRIVNEGIAHVEHLVPAGGEYLLDDVGDLVWRWSVVYCAVVPPFLERWPFEEWDPFRWVSLV